MSDLTSDIIDSMIHSNTGYMDIPLLCAAHQLLWVNILMDPTLKGTRIELLKEGKRRWPLAWKSYYEHLMRFPKWRGPYPVATEEERFRAKYRRKFKQWEFIQRRDGGDYWDWDVSIDEKWELFSRRLDSE